MKSGKMLKPGQPGTKKWLEKFGDRLYCIRYRYDKIRKKRFITAEIIVEESHWQEKGQKIPKNKIIAIQVKYEGAHLRKVVKSAGGKWDPKRKVWELPYQDALNWGLTHRIVRV